MILKQQTKETEHLLSIFVLALLEKNYFLGEIYDMTQKTTT